MKVGRFEIFSSSINQLVKSVQTIKSRKIAQYGLKGTTALCLCLVGKNDGGLTATELSKMGEIDKAQVSRCVTELIESGFIYRDDLEGKHYKQKYRLTEKGEAAAKDLLSCGDKIEEALEKGITAEEYQNFTRTLYRLCGNFEELIAKEK